ncbi:hypothetical protein Hte_004414 [Hypoxylon texense]
MAAFPAGSDFTYWWPRDVGAMRAWQAGRIRGWLANPRTREFKVVDEAAGRVAAFAKWDPPASLKGLDDAGLVVADDGRNTVPVVEHMPEGKGGGGGGGGGKEEAVAAAQKNLGAPEGCNREMYDDLFKGMDRMREKWRADDKLLSLLTQKIPVLHIIATDPAYHGRGIGTALIKCVLDVADAEGIPTYLEALPLAVPLYRRLGFAVVDKAVFDLAKAGMEGTAALTIMVREPVAGAGAAAPAA